MVRKALIPIAGSGKRMAPVTSVVPKAMLPLPAGRSGVLPVLHWILAEAAAAGADQTLLICSPGQVDLVQRYLDVDLECDLPALPERIRIEIQDAPAGFGDAVAVGRGFVGDEPFVLLLGDHVHIPARSADPCAAQVVRAHEKAGGVATIGVQPVGVDQLSRLGVPKGHPTGSGLYKCTDFAEKPDLATATGRLLTPGLEKGQFLGHCGIYVFGPEIFDCLAALAPQAQQEGKELQLADAQSVLLAKYPEQYYLQRIDGRAYDTGTPENYVKAVAAFAEINL